MTISLEFCDNLPAFNTIIISYMITGGEEPQTAATFDIVDLTNSRCEKLKD